ncbi:hypothetical protein SERLA73DRAFT_159361, partial [Serpula lacrymans var. lacrymans S7.3]
MSQSTQLVAQDLIASSQAISGSQLHELMQAAVTVDAHHSTFSDIGRDQINNTTINNNYQAP